MGVASSPGFTAGLPEALWTDEDLYVFNGKRVSSKGITGGLGEEREEEGGDNSQHTCGESGRQRLGRDLPLLSSSSLVTRRSGWGSGGRWRLDAVAHEPLNLPTLWAAGRRREGGGNRGGTRRHARDPKRGQRGAAKHPGSKGELIPSYPNHWRNFDLLLLFLICLFCAAQRLHFSKIRRNFNRPLISVSHELKC